MEDSLFSKGSISCYLTPNAENLVALFIGKISSMVQI